MAYAGVDDVKAATATAKSLGAAVMKDVTELAGAGWFSIITDPAPCSDCGNRRRRDAPTQSLGRDIRAFTPAFDGLWGHDSNVCRRMVMMRP
jgi:hypothetical protein